MPRSILDNKKAAERHRLMSEILSVLNGHVGKKNAISRPDLLKDLKTRGVFEADRIVRDTINLLRKKGFLILSTGGTGGGYWLAENLDEVNSFFETEIDSRIKDLNDQKTAMRRSAIARFGNQLSFERKMAK